MSQQSLKPPALKKFLVEKCFIGFGIINGIINGAIFYFINKNNSKALSFFEIGMDFLITAIILSFVVAFIAQANAKSFIKKSGFPEISYNKEDHLFIRFFPKNSFMKALVIAILCGIIFAPLFCGVGVMINIPTTLYPVMILKGVACSFIGGFTGYFAILSQILEEKPQGN
ncbi:MAG: hypothetical protein RR048_00350 [Oscillospiraceae bacterium]